MDKNLSKKDPIKVLDLSSLVRENLRKFTPYSSARNEFTGEAVIFLDANENSLGSPLTQAYHLYPDPLQKQLKQKISEIKGIPSAQIFLGNGSDEVIDLLYRIFCHPGLDHVILCPPTYGMYEVSAQINGIDVVKIPLKPNYQLNTQAILSATSPHSRMIFLCSPNNPTGNDFRPEDLEKVLKNFPGIVLVDEAYIDFSDKKSLSEKLDQYPNLIVMQTLSKAWGLAGLRIGMAFTSEEIVEWMNKIKPPYNISQAAQTLALEALDQQILFNQRVKIILEEREKLAKALTRISIVKQVYPSVANFLLIKTTAAREIYHYLIKKGIVVRDRSRVMLCEGCLRITIGKVEENQHLIEALQGFQNDETV
ncbi:MAG: histidinol-phosphate transaminase [Flavobacteriales bacterium AspAUS03]